jgi:hypothetical protein
MTQETDAVYHTATQNADGSQEVYVDLTHDSDQREKVILCESPWVIPVVFVPGVMGSNLKVKGKKEKVWQPPNNLAESISLLGDFVFKKPRDRQQLFNPENAEVDWDGPIDEGDLKLGQNKEQTLDILRQRGWGSVYSQSYHPFLQTLHKQLNSELYKDSALGAWWQQHMLQDPSLWGSTNTQDKALTEADLKALKRYRFEVWACGYNWLQSNAQSGQDLAAYIQKVLDTYAHKGCQPVAKKVIVVTHSMGGLVLRGLLQDAKAASQILGVVHGVQPAAGAPAVYKRMRAGFEGVEQIIFARDAAEAVPVLANSPALLEMLPFANYNQQQPWLKVGNGAKADLALPDNGNPYEQIYASTAWYGLIPEENTKLMDPAALVANNLEPGQSVRSVFETNLAKIAKFHKAISTEGASYHPHTYAHCAVDSSQKTWGEVWWSGSVTENTELQAQSLSADDLDSHIELSSQIRLTLAGPAQAGDGTVPAWSSTAPYGQAHNVFVHGQGQVPQHNALNAARAQAPAEAPAWQKSYDHQNSYLDPRSHWATLYAIARLTPLADWGQGT